MRCGKRSPRHRAASFLTITGLRALRASSTPFPRLQVANPTSTPSSARALRGPSTFLPTASLAASDSSRSNAQTALQGPMTFTSSSACRQVLTPVIPRVVSPRRSATKSALSGPSVIQMVGPGPTPLGHMTGSPRRRPVRAPR